MEFAGIGGTVHSIRPIIQYKKFIPVQNRRNALGFNVQGSFISGWGGLVAPPFQRFFMGGENDIRGFDIRSVSPVAFLPSSNVITLTNPDGTPVPKNPANPRLGNWTIPIPVDQIVFPGGDLSVFTNLEYRITIAGPVAIVPFWDMGIDPIIRRSQLQIAQAQYDQVVGTLFGCPTLDAGYNCQGGSILNPRPSNQLQVLGQTNWSRALPPASNCRCSCPWSMRRSASTGRTTRCGLTSRPTRRFRSRQPCSRRHSVRSERRPELSATRRRAPIPITWQ